MESNKPKNRFIPALALATAGVGVGNLTATPTEIETSAPVPQECVVESRQELHHGVDDSLRKSLKELPANAKNSDVVALVDAKNKKIIRLEALNTKAAETLKGIRKTNRNAVRDYYGG